MTNLSTFRLKIHLRIAVDLLASNLVASLMKPMMILTTLCSIWPHLIQSLLILRLKDSHRLLWPWQDKQYILMKKVTQRMHGSEKKKLWKRSWKRRLLINLKLGLRNRIDKLEHQPKTPLQSTTTIIMIVIWNLLKNQIQICIMEAQVQ